MNYFVQLAIFGISLIIYGCYLCEALHCFTCTTRRGNFACNRMILRCDQGYEACEVRTSVKGTGHLASITKGCTKTCDQNRRRRCRDTGSGLRGCSYCCTGEMCNVGLNARGDNPIDNGLTRNNNITLEERPPSFSVIANDVIDKVDDGMPIHLINISRIVTNIGNIIAEELGFAEITITIPGTYVFHATSVASDVSSNATATSLILMRNHDIVMRVGRETGKDGIPFPFASDNVVLDLYIGDVIMLATSPTGSDDGPFSTPSDVTFSGYLLHGIEL